MYLTFEEMPLLVFMCLVLTNLSSRGKKPLVLSISSATAMALRCSGLLASSVHSLNSATGSNFTQGWSRPKFRSSRPCAASPVSAEHRSSRQELLSALADAASLLLAQELPYIESTLLRSVKWLPLERGTWVSSSSLLGISFSPDFRLLIFSSLTHTASLPNATS